MIQWVLEKSRWFFASGENQLPYLEIHEGKPFGSSRHKSCKPYLAFIFYLTIVNYLCSTSVCSFVKITKLLMTSGAVKVIVLAHGYFRWAGSPSSPLHADLGSLGTVPIWVDGCYFSFSGRNGVRLGIRLPRYDVAFGFVGLEKRRKEEEWDVLCAETMGNPRETYVHSQA